MTQLLRNTSINRKALLSLARSLSHDREAFLQILLDFCSKRTFNRIARCPTYPAKIVTLDLAERRQLLCESVALDLYEIPHALAFLYETATERERRKKHGQYFTPAYVSREVVAQLALRSGETLLDPGCGTGIFALSVLRELRGRSKDPASSRYLGIENDPLLALSTAVSLDWADAPDSWRVLYANYLNVRPDDVTEIIGNNRKIDAVICNPPYVRYHRLEERSDLATRLNLHTFSGLHSYFLEYSSKLAPLRRMIFVVPMEMNRTKYGTKQLEHLRSKFKVDNKVAYYDERNHFWNVQASEEISLEMHTKMKHAWSFMLFHPIAEDVTVSQNSRHNVAREKGTISLDNFASVQRGISTGANDFFVITDKLANEIGVSEKEGYLKRVIPTKIPKARLKDVFDEKEWNVFKDEGKPCWLLSLSEEKSIELPSGLKAYLKKGERLGVHLIPTCKNREPRRPWYYIKVQTVHVPDLFFTYISRGSPIFIYNKAQVHNLTNLLGVYLEISVTLSEDEIRKLVRLLNGNIKEWIDQKSVGRRYSGGIVKFEPKDLERMPISKSALSELRIGSSPFAISLLG
jgi:adenine-specific DNA-methyltransferase